jgi:hypothetical protein
MSKRMSNIEKADVIEEVIGLLAKANNSSAICRHLIKKHGIKDRQAKNYIANARQEIVKRFKPELTSEKLIAGIRFQDLYQKNYIKGDYKECRAVQESFNKLFGINEPEKSEENLTISIGITEKDVENFNSKFNSKYK